MDHGSLESPVMSWSLLRIDLSSIPFMRTVNHWVYTTTATSQVALWQSNIAMETGEMHPKMVDFQISHVSLLEGRFNDKTWLVLEAYYSTEVAN